MSVCVSMIRLFAYQENKKPEVVGKAKYTFCGSPLSWSWWAGFCSCGIACVTQSCRLCEQLLQKRCGKLPVLFPKRALSEPLWPAQGFSSPAGEPGSPAIHSPQLWMLWLLVPGLNCCQAWLVRLGGDGCPHFIPVHSHLPASTFPQCMSTELAGSV